MNESPPQIAELLALYRHTHYDVTLPDGSDATLRIGAPSPPALVEWIGTDRHASYLLSLIHI